MPEGALTPFTAYDAYRYCGPGIVNDVTHRIFIANGLYYSA